MKYKYDLKTFSLSHTLNCHLRGQSYKSCSTFSASKLTRKQKMLSANKDDSPLTKNVNLLTDNLQFTNKQGKLRSKIVIC